MPQRRHFIRVLFKSLATLRWDGRQTACEVRDLSLKGALLAPPAGVRLPAGTACTLELRLDAGGETLIVMEGTIAHQHDQVLGLRCSRIDLDSITHLRRLVELNGCDEAELQRELSALSSE